jgi:hypothetical protein
MLLASFICIASLGFASAAPADVEAVPMGNDTYSITREAGSAFTRDTDKLKAKVADDAAKYCAAQGKQLKVVSLTGNVPRFSTGYAKAKIVFMALSPGDPRLLAEAPSANPMAPAAFMGPPPGRLSTDELVSELTKLDDLRKKGILTDEEFQAEKKKILSRSN